MSEKCKFLETCGVELAEYHYKNYCSTSDHKECCYFGINSKKTPKDWNEFRQITLSHEQRLKLAEEIECPHCGCKVFQRHVIEFKGNPLFKDRAIYQCEKCGYWTDVFDGYTWHPKEELKETTPR